MDKTWDIKPLNGMACVVGDTVGGQSLTGPSQ